MVEFSFGLLCSDSMSGTIQSFRLLMLALGEKRKILLAWKSIFAFFFSTSTLILIPPPVNKDNFIKRVESR